MRPERENPARRFFEARRVAVVGASRSPGKAGFHQVDNLRRHYSGEVFPVNPNADRIAGYRCYPALDAIEPPIDLAIVLRPAADVLPAFEACIARGIPAVLVPAAGFAEAGEEGEALQAHMVQRARASGVALWGPNCGGFVHTANGLFASFIDLARVRTGGIGIVAQSGIYVAGLLNQLMERPSFGVSTVASLGNACDVGAADVFEYLAEDPATTVIALHLEGLQEGARLLRAARSVAGRKPVVAALVGGTESGAEASRSHTANLAVPGRVAAGLLAQAGIVQAREFIDLVDLAGACALMGTPRPARRVATISTSGGAGVIAADYADEFGIAMARLAPATRTRLGVVHPFARGVDNPIDAWPAMERHGTAVVMPEIADAVFHDPGVDAVLFGMGAYSGGGDEFDPRMVGRAHAGSGKPAVAWLYGPSTSLDEWRSNLESIGIPCFGDLRGAVAALAGWDRMYRRGLEPDPPAPAVDAERLRRLRAAADAARSAGQVSLSEAEALALLDAWGVSTVPREPARTPAEAAAAAGRLGWPVVLKAVSRDLAHKTEAGAVAVGLDSERAVRAAWRTISDSVTERAPQARIDGMMVQSMLHGREIIAGLARVPGVGPVVMAGCGGLLVESRAEVAFRLPPLDHAEADRMIVESGVSVVLDAHRGGPAGDRCAVRDLLVRLAALADTDAGIHEVEINPLIVGDEGAGATAVDALVVVERR